MNYQQWVGWFMHEWIMLPIEMVRSSAKNMLQVMLLISNMFHFSANCGVAGASNQNLWSLRGCIQDLFCWSPGYQGSGNVSARGHSSVQWIESLRKRGIKPPEAPLLSRDVLRRCEANMVRCGKSTISLDDFRSKAPLIDVPSNPLVKSSFSHGKMTMNWRWIPLSADSYVINCWLSHDIKVIR